MKNVIATAPGFHGGCRIRTGETFSVPDEEQGSWFVEAAPGKPPAPSRKGGRKNQADPETLGEIARSDADTLPPGDVPATP
ncbi:hypothetical protein LH417_00815 [Laribacter hongkongensis]|uniref:hypothetical protein n=1 Tax=Laribacter hongkongensis TaxID=168471 RepID=UPI001EFCED96|nr:hypothetical protein [Laribacter hongkongensis]MCG9021506.1 hypothetical protein [Laribacter hongkongensis]